MLNSIGGNHSLTTRTVPRDPGRTNPPPHSPHELTDDLALDPESQKALLLKVLLEGEELGDAREELQRIKRLIEGKDLNALEDESIFPGNNGPSSTQINKESQASTSNTQLSIEAVQADVLELSIESTQDSVQVTVLSAHYESLRLKTNPAPPPPPPPKDPLVLDLQGNGPQTTGSSGSQMFDLEGNGTTKLTSFVTGASAFLALDRDGNGRIDSGKELFGDQHGAIDGFEELKKFDLNQDQRIDAEDPVFNNLLLLKGDQSLSSLISNGITGISLGAITSPQITTSGDSILRSAEAYRTDGRTLGVYAMGLNTFDNQA